MIYYLIGIKGSGVSSLARLLYDKGHIVKGVDVNQAFYTDKNIKCCHIESFENMILNKEYYYIIGNAYMNHSVTNYIKRKGYYYKTYPEFIAEFFKDYYFISVSGTHGKTTTTKMVAELIDGCNYIIGDGSGHGDKRKIFVLESCEYRDTFLNYHPDVSIILNMDYDHPDYFKNEDNYVESFKKFSNQSGEVIINGDDKNYDKLKNDRFISYGILPHNDIVFKYRIEDGKSIVKVLEKEFVIPLFGLHYAYDFVGAYLVSKLVGTTDKYINDRINKFKLPNRRMEERRIGNVLIIHDYAHHPKEIKCVYDTISIKFKDKNKICIFQPHTISRSIALKEEFKEVLDLFDNTILLPIFTSVRENKDKKIEDELYEYWGYEAISFEDALNMKMDENNVYLYLGAGDIYDLFSSLKQ